MKIEEMIALMEAIDKNNIDNFSYSQGEERIQIKKNKKKIIVNNSLHGMEAAEQNDNTSLKFFNNVNNEIKDETNTADNNKIDTNRFSSDDVITSPLVGTFYASPSPEAETFVKIGDAVKKGQVIGIIEAMKLMNEVESEFDGIVEAILVEDESIVEYGQPLLRIRPVA